MGAGSVLVWWNILLLAVLAWPAARFDLHQFRRLGRRRMFRLNREKFALSEPEQTAWSCFQFWLVVDLLGNAIGLAALLLQD